MCVCVCMNWNSHISIVSFHHFTIGFFFLSLFLERMQMNDLQHGFAIEMAMRMNRICLNLIVPQMWKLENALMVFQSNWHLQTANNKRQTHLMNAIITSSCVIPATLNKLNRITRQRLVSVALIHRRKKKTNECTCTLDAVDSMHTIFQNHSLYPLFVPERIFGQNKRSYIICHANDDIISDAYCQSVYTDLAICLPFRLHCGH